MYRVQLENFQGPLDLLLFFIRRDEIDIYDIPIARITKEFLNTLDLMHSLNISVAGEFINMAATLMRIKARMMLPMVGMDEQENIEDPRTELVRQLLEYQRFKEVAGDLNTLESKRRQYYPRQAESGVPDADENIEVYLKEFSLFDLAQFFKAAMDAMPVINTYELKREPINLDEQKTLVLSSFGNTGRVRFSKLVSQLKTKLEIVVTFMAILDLISQNQIKVFQNSLFGDLEMQLTVHIA